MMRLLDLYRGAGGAAMGYHRAGNNAKGRGSRRAKQQAMGIDWMTDVELNEAIPPAYTEYIGRQLRQCIDA